MASLAKARASAVRQFQALLGLPETGELDDETARAIIVAYLPALLTMLGFEISDDEQWRATPGDSTREAVRRFQDEQVLEGRASWTTRRADALLAQAGNGRFVVTGKITDIAGNPFTSGTVQALDVRCRYWRPNVARRGPTGRRRLVQDRIHGQAGARVG